MTNIYKWHGPRHLRSKSDEHRELGFREHGMLEIGRLPAHLLPPMRLYHRWLAGQHKQVRRVSRQSQSYAGNYLSGDPTDRNWLAFITGGAIGMLKACGLPAGSAPEFISCSLFLCDVTWSGGRASRMRREASKLHLQTSRNWPCMEQPTEGIQPLGKAHIAWWLTQPESQTTVTEAAADEICQTGILLELTVDHTRAIVEAARLEVKLLTNNQNNLTWLQVWVPQNLRLARKRRGQRRPTSFADLHEPPYALLPSAVS
jgi:hypothetical protein